MSPGALRGSGAVPWYPQPWQNWLWVRVGGVSQGPPPRCRVSDPQLSAPSGPGPRGPFPLILLPQFGGYWIERHQSRNHQHPRGGAAAGIHDQGEAGVQPHRPPLPEALSRQVGWPAGLGVLGWVGRGHTQPWGVEELGWPAVP